MQCCLLKLALSATASKHLLWNQPVSCHSQILPGRGVEAALSLSRAVPLHLLRMRKGNAFFQQQQAGKGCPSCSLGVPGPCFTARDKVVLGGNGICW